MNKNFKPAWRPWQREIGKCFIELKASLYLIFKVKYVAIPEQDLWFFRNKVICESNNLSIDTYKALGKGVRWGERREMDYLKSSVKASLALQRPQR